MEVQPWCYRPAEREWCQVHKHQDKDDDDEDYLSAKRIEEPHRKVKFVTLNVLFDSWNGKPYKTHLVHSPLRYRAQFRMLAEMDPDFICLNEVTPSFVQLITKEEWVKEQYWISDASEDCPTLAPFGNLLMSKYPIERCFAIPLSKTARLAIAAIINVDRPESKKRICVCSAHLSALNAYAERRKMQLNELCDQLEGILQENPCDEVFIMGDFNFHQPTEDASIPDSYSDVWHLLRPEDGGYTFDALLNPMIPEMWPLGFEKRRMRLDRIIQLNNESKDDRICCWRPASIKIFANTPVCERLGLTPRKIKERRKENEREKAMEEEEEIENEREKEEEVHHLLHNDITTTTTTRRQRRGRSGMMWQWGVLWFLLYLGGAIVKVLFDCLGVNVLRNKYKYLYPSDHFGLVAEFEVVKEGEDDSRTMYSSNM